MSPTVLFAICILASDFLLYVLFRWTYPNRRANPRPAKSSNPALAGNHLI